MIIPIHPDLSMSNILIPNVQTHKDLGIHLSCDGSRDYHIKVHFQTLYCINFVSIHALSTLKYCQSRHLTGGGAFVN